MNELVNSYLQEHRHDVLLSPYNGLMEFAKLVCQWQKEQKTKLFLEGLDEAATEYEEWAESYDTGDYPTYLSARDAFKAGAEWAIGQGVIGEVKDFHCIREVDYASAKIEFATIPELKYGDKVIVQIRKK